MGAKYQLEIERAAAEMHATRRPAAVEAPAADRSDAAEPAARRQLPGLHVQTGEALSSFDARCYPLCFTEFFYGDCAPNLERPAQLTRTLYPP